MKPKSMFTTALVLGLITAGPAVAQPAPGASLLDSPLVVNVGTFVFSTDLTARLDGQSVRRPEVDFDKTFGFGDSANRVRADVLWRVTPEHHLRFLYFDNSRSSTRTLLETVEWGDLTFRPGSSVTATAKFTIAELAYEYAFLRWPETEVAGSIGVHYADLSLKLAGVATVGSSSVGQVQFASKESSLPAPLPVVGLRAVTRVSRNVYLDAQGQFFRVTIDGYKGNLYDLRAGATWMFSRSFGAGLGYNRFLTSVDVDRTSFEGRVRMGYSGLQLFLTGAL